MKFVDGTRNRKKHVQVDIPFTVREYSSYMGGVDLLDCFLCKYMCPSEVYKKVYAALLETLTMVLINDWLLYCRVRQSLSLLQKSVLKRRNFQQVASALIEVNTAKKKKTWEVITRTGRNRISDPPRKIRKGPCVDVQDVFAHWPVKVVKGGHCKVSQVNIIDTICEKCNMRLCFNRNRNCYNQFHVY